MQISDQMMAAARKSAPELSEERIRALFRDVLKDGQLVFRCGEGRGVADGKFTWPVHLQLQVSDPLEGMALAKQLLSGAQRALEGQEGARVGVTLSLAGDAMISE